MYIEAAFIVMDQYTRESNFEINLVITMNLENVCGCGAVADI